ncbi:MAG: serine/threonine-protein kinase [Candidatus Sumerlaeaceae bacterium]
MIPDSNLPDSTPTVNAEPTGSGLAAAHDSRLDTELAPNRRGSSGRGAEPVILGEGTEIHGVFRYRLESQLGRGGFGSVYRATCLETGDPRTIPPELVAIKFFHRPEAGNQLSMLKREVSALLPLQHERIIRLYDWSFERSPCFMAVEYHPDGSLLDTDYFLGKPIDEATLVALLRDILSALNAAHQASILHLDIKPGNILRDSAGHFVLTDFGISQGSLVSHHIVETGLGSPGYQSPEQRECNRRWFGARTDLWGLGATAWSLYTGLRLDLHQQVLLHSSSNTVAGLPPLSDFRPCRLELEQFIMQLVAMEPSNRPGGAAEALAALHALYGIAPRESTAESDQLKVHITGDAAIRPVIDGLVDPLWYSICSAPRPILSYVHFKKDEVLCCQGEDAYRTFVLLSGAVVVQRDGNAIARESREGSFMGENATLTGRPRTATIRADEPVWALMFNAAELEQFVMANPAVAIRLIKTLALRNRLNNGTQYGSEGSAQVAEYTYVI